MPEPDHNDREFKRSLQRDSKLIQLNREFKSIGFFTKGVKLNKREGIAGDVYLGFLRDNPVAIKMADDFATPAEIQYFYKENNFLHDQEIKPLSISLLHQNFDLQVEFAQLEPEIMSSPFKPSDVMVSKFSPPLD